MRTAFWLLQFTALASVCAAQPTSISGNAGIGSAVVNLTGPQTLSVTSDSGGNYSFYRLPPGTYIVAPSLSGYTFNPSSQSVTIDFGGSVASVNFSVTAAATTAVIPTQTGLAAYPLNLSLNAAEAAQQLQVVATYSNGYSLDVSSAATYASNNNSVATVSQNGLVTALANGGATIIASYGAMASSVSVTVTIPAVTYSISGTAGAAAATLTLSGAASATTAADGNGMYSFGGLASGSYVITPSLSGYTFSPSSRWTTIGNANVTVNFIASAAPQSVDLSWGPGSIQNPAAGQVVAGYNVYRSSVSGGPYTQLNSSPTPALNYVDSAVSAGQIFYYVCSTVDNMGNISSYSNEAAAMVR